MPIDLSRYVNPGNPLPGVDLAAGLRWLGELNLQRERMAQQQGQFDTTEDRVNREHADEVAHQQRVESDVNSRFALELDNKENLKNQELKIAQSNKRLTLTAKAREAVAQGDWNTAHALAGTLADLGTKVDITQNPDGSPNFRFENPEDSYQDNQSFEGIMGRINGQRNPFEQLPGQYQAPQPQQTIQQQKPNTYDTILSPEEEQKFQSWKMKYAPNDSGEDYDLRGAYKAGIVPDKQSGHWPDTFKKPNHPTFSNQSQYASSAPDKAGSWEGEKYIPNEQSTDPRMLNSATLQQQNEMRLNPVLEGIQGALPTPWSTQISPFMQGVKSLRMSPKATMGAMQKPFETIASLYRAKDATEAAQGRASASESRAESSDARQRQFRANTDARMMDERQYKISESVKNISDFELIRQKINGNRNEQADAIKQLIGMREGGRITDQDFQIGLTGIASNWETALTGVQRVYKDGLLPLEKLRFNQMLDKTFRNYENKIRFGRDALKRMAKGYRDEPERLGVRTYLNAAVPQQYWDEEMLNYDALKDQGGRPSGVTPNTRSSVSVSGNRRGPRNTSTEPIPDTATTTDGVENPVKDINAEIDELLSQ